MGGLRLYVYEKKIHESQETKKFLWEKFGDQGNLWHTASYQYFPQEKLEVNVFKILSLHTTSWW